MRQLTPEALDARQPAGAEGRPRWFSVALVMVAQSTQAVVFGGIALFLPLIRREVGMTFTAAGALASSAAITYTVMQIPSGLLADRFGSRRIFLVGLLGTNLLALSFSQLHTYWLFVGNQAFAGVFRALLFAPGMVLMASLFAPERRATALGLFVAGGFSSSVFLNLLGPVLVGWLGWRRLFVAFAVGGLQLTLAFLRFGPRPRARPATSSLRGLLGLFRHGVVWQTGGIQFVRLALVQGVAFWLPTFLVVDKGQPLQLAGVAVAISAAMTAPSNFLGGYLSDRLRNPGLVIRGSLAVLALTTFLLVHVDQVALLLVVIAVNGFFVQIYFGPLFSIPMEALGGDAAGMTSGAGNFFANMGGFCAIYLMGALKDLTGTFGAGLTMLAALCLAGLVMTVGLGRYRPAPGPSRAV
jgi:DHA1 family inner membrane transport protein